MPLFNVPNQNLAQTRTDFKIKEFRKLIQQKGVRIAWEKTVQCPCYYKTTDELNFDLSNIDDISVNKTGNVVDCPACKGSGLVRYDREIIKGVISDLKNKDEVDIAGLITKGEIKITLEPEHLPTYGDKFTLIDSVIVWNQTFTVEGDSVELDFPVVERQLELQSGLETIGVLYLQKTDINGLGIIDNTVPTHTIEDNVITFTDNATKPEIGTKCVISYYINPVYIVSEHPHIVRDTILLNNSSETYSQLPVQTFARLQTYKGT